MSRFLALGFALRVALAAALVSACGSASEDEPGSSPDAQAADQTPASTPPADASVPKPMARPDTGPPSLPPHPQSSPVACDFQNADPGPALIRRLTRREYNNTIRDLLGDVSAPANGFTPDEEFMGFNNQAASLGMTPLHAEQYMQASERLSETAVTRLESLLPCQPAVVGEAACLRAFVISFGRRAFRRPLLDEEVDGLMTLYDAALDMDPPRFERAFRLVIQALLQSPNFLFRIEVGEVFDVIDVEDGRHEDKDRLRLTDYEMASRLSYLLWQSMPDSDLFDAAERGELTTAEQVKAQARRLLAEDRARHTLLDFFDQWLRIGEVYTLSRDASAYPDFNEGLRPLFAAESHAFIEDLLWGPVRDLTRLFDADYTFMNETIARYFGVPGVVGSQMRKVPLDPTQRAGILTHASIMAVTAKPNRTSPVNRGVYVRDHILCTPLPPPPPDLPIVPPSPDPTRSTRQQFEEHSANPVCAGCHVLIDPIGFGFENLDADGRWRTTENGHVVDASGEMTATLDADGPFVGAAALSRQLANSEQVHRCAVTQYFRFAQGRGETRADLCSLDQLYLAYEDGGRDLVSMVEQLTSTNLFRFRRRPLEGALEGANAEAADSPENGAQP